MAPFGFNSHQMLISVLLVYATRRTANCIALAILIGTYQLVNDLHARRGKACVHICMPLQIFLYTKPMLTWNWSVTRQTGTECHIVLVGSRFQLQETVSAGTGSCGVSCLSCLCWTIILAVWWSDSNKMEQYY